jgi:hypothetical protein
MATKAETLAAVARGAGCLGKAADDEPVFVLRAHDGLAPDVVEFWVDLAKAHGAPPEKIAGAMTLATEMRAWAARNGSKWPD